MIRPWDEIKQWYCELVDAGLNVRGMLSLVEKIEGSRYARSLYAWTSMHDLCIVQVPCDPIDSGPYLRISPFFDGTIEFRYIDTNVESKQWRRIVKEDETFNRLECFMDQLRWVAREKKA